MAFDATAQGFQVRQGLLDAVAAEEHRKFFAAVTEGAAAAAGIREVRGHHLEHVVADVVPVGVVEALEVIDVDHSDGIAPAEAF